MTKELNKTPLYETCLKYGAKFIEFAGWELPVQYSSIKEEHHACRKAATLWDVSNMGEIMVEGKNSLDFLQMLLTNDISKGYPGKVIYSPMCYPDGGVVDDMMAVCLEGNRFLLVVNAVNIDKDYQWISGLARYFTGVSVKQLSDEYALVALQGPNLNKSCKNSPNTR